MSDAVLKLLPQVKALSIEEWLELRELMDESEEGELTPEESDAAWLPVLERRSNELSTGVVKGISRAEFFAALDAQRARK
jgi:hypothetical protein